MVKKRGSSLTDKSHLLWYTGGFLVLVFVLMSQEQVTVEEVEIINELGEVEAQDSNDLSGQAYRRRSRTYIACSDTDNGNINSKGTRKYSYKYGRRSYTRSNTDYCYNGRSRYYRGKLMEYSCNGKKPSFKAVTCPKGCNNGACISDSPSTSKQSISNNSSKIWKKHRNYLGPPYCNQPSRLGGPSLCSSPRRKTNLDGKDCSAYKTGQTVKTAYTSGYNFICTEKVTTTKKPKVTTKINISKPKPTCTESDNGIDYFKKGTVMLGTSGYEDTCYQGGLREYYCFKGQVITYQVICANGCSKGACLQKTTTPINNTRQAVRGTNTSNNSSFVAQTEYNNQTNNSTK